MQSVLKKIAIFVLALALIAAFGCKGDTPPIQTDEQGTQPPNEEDFALAEHLREGKIRISARRSLRFSAALRT